MSDFREKLEAIASTAIPENRVMSRIKFEALRATNEMEAWKFLHHFISDEVLYGKMKSEVAADYYSQLNALKGERGQ